jgi:putative addiction module component (TIGR02574 family)
MMDVATVMKEVGNWPIEDRLQLIEEVWGSLADHSAEITLSDAHRQDLQRRLDTYRDDPKAGSPWEEVEVRLRGHGR